MSRYFGTKQFYREAVAIAFPVMLQQFVASFVNLIDNVMIGSVGATALTSVTVANKFYLLYNSTLFGMCGAAGIFISQYFGAKNERRCQEVFNINLACALVVALFFTVLSLLFPVFLLSLFTRTQEILSMGKDYLGIIAFSFVPMAVSFTAMMALRAVAINDVPLKIGFVTVFTNTFLNYCLIYGNFGFPALGVKGAALATLAARLVEMSIYLFLLFKRKYLFSLDWHGLWHLNHQLFRSMVDKAAPLTANEILFSLGNSMVYKSYLRVDEYLAAAITVVDTVVNIAFIIFSGLSSAVSIMIGKRLGAGELAEAKENSLKLLVFGTLVAAGIGAVVFVIAAYVPNLYHLDAEINQTITTLLRIKSCLMPAYVINVCIFFTLRAGGDAKSTLIMDSGFLWLGNVLVSFLLSTFTNWPLVVVYALVEGMDLVKLLLSTHYYRQGTWLRNLTY